MADSMMLSCIGEFVADDIDMAMAAEQLMQLSGDDDGGADSVNGGTRSTAADDDNSSKKRKKRSEKVEMRERNENEDEVVILVMEPRRVRKYRSLHNLYMLTKPISNLRQ